MTVYVGATADGKNYDAYPATTVTLTAGAGHITAIIGILAVLLLVI